MKRFCTGVVLAGMMAFCTSQAAAQSHVVVNGSVFGGGNAAEVSGNTSVLMQQNATVVTAVYGGGAFASTGTYGTTTTTVTIEGGTVGDGTPGNGNVFGGALGDGSHSPLVNGKVTVNIGTANQTSPTQVDEVDNYNNVVITGAVFGCNNSAGTPMDSVKVNIYHTAHTAANAVSGSTYALSQVFGGGNQASYTPTAANKAIVLHVHNCDNTIGYLYGGGNAANAGTSGGVEVDVKTEIDGGRHDWIFGGGNGAGPTNPGANIYGDVTLTVHAGSYQHLFGGSNEKGVISGSTNVQLLGDGSCGLRTITELYGGNNLAPGTDASLTVSCNADPAKRWTVGSIYGGSRNAKLTGDVELTIEGGTFTNVFGGNNAGDTIRGDVTLNLYGGTITNAFGGNNAGGNILGDITLNVTDAGNDCPLNVDYIYGGGNEAAYTPANASTLHPEVNINHLRSGYKVNYDVYGGGLGATATVTANPVVNIGDDNANHYATVGHNVYGGGSLADVIGNTNVNITGNGHVGATDPSQTDGFVFGGGKGSITDPQYANVKGNTHVVMTDGYVHNTLFGGGELALVGDFKLADADYATAHPTFVEGEPYSLKTANTGRCLVEISGGQIGHKDATLKQDIGYVFGAGMGVYTDPHAAHEPAPSAMNARFGYVNTAEVQISGTAFIVGAVWGGSENGQVLDSCGVKVSGGQIGTGYDWKNKVGKGLYTTLQWDEAVAAVKAQDASRINDIAAAMPECYHWPFGREENGVTHYLPYDPYASLYGATDASENAGDGHTFFGNVFGGGSGYYAYKSGTEAPYTIDWYDFQGRVRGNTYVEISGGHILTSVYGGCEYADVVGDCRVVMTGGTLGLPRTLDSITDHPVTSYLFGAGKGDQRTEFNMRTNVQNVNVKVSGGLIFGSVFGGGEDGHVLGNAKVTIDSAAWIGTWGTSYVDGNIFGGGRGFGGTAYTAGSIGGNVTVNINNDTVAGTPVRPIMLGSVYGGGRLASVGTHFVETTDPRYSMLQGSFTDNTGHTDIPVDTAQAQYHGNITINITGGTIGNLSELTHPAFDPAASYSVGDVVAYQNQMYRFTSAHPAGAWNQAHVTDIVHTTGGNVFGSSMGRLFKLGATDETDPNSFLRIWPGMAKCRNTQINISGDATIYSNVYGGGELGYVMKDTKVTIDGSEVTIGHGVATGTTDACYLGSVYGGGYGSDNITEHTNDTISITTTNGFVTAAMHAGRV
ncbi:MAG: hypothetical protein J6Y52_00725, partial [Bacteroidales bacterium]|nr:hypothetical protein [Bacteroidales bacterium]